MDRALVSLLSVFLGWTGGESGGDVKSPATIARLADVPLRVRVLELEGIEWRRNTWNRLNLLQAGATMTWTADARTLGQLVGYASKETTPRTGDPLIDQNRALAAQVQNINSWMGRLADGPPGKASRIAFKPTFSKLSDETKCDVSGHRNPEGTLVDASISDTQVLRGNTVPIEESTRNPAQSIAASYVVPEVVSATVKGTWTLPKGEGLVIGLGAHRADNGTGGTVLQERVVLIDALDLDESAFALGQQYPQQPSGPGTLIGVGRTGRFLVWATILGLPLFAAGLFGWFLGRGYSRPED
ncbi:MAG: hypothetical protein NVSMB9_21550 [Isosphaeraceae bacterium]